MKLLQLLLVLGLSASINGFHGGWHYTYPSTCQKETCLYLAKWDWDSNDNCVTFTVAAKQSNTTWAGIGFTRNNTMENADLLYGYINSTGHGVAFEGTWMPESNSAPVKNPVQHFCNSTVYYEDGFLWVVISKPRISPNGFNFTDTDCYFPLFPIGGGSIVDDYGTINKPNDLPKTTDLICFNETKVGVTEPTESLLTMKTEKPLGINDDYKEVVIWMFPKNCSINNTLEQECKYFSFVEYNSAKGIITIRVAAQLKDGHWTGIGYTNSSTPTTKLHMIVGYLKEDGTGEVFNGLANSIDDAPVKSNVNLLLSSAIWRVDGFMLMNATFKRDVINITCPYLVFPEEGGVVNNDGTLSKPTRPMNVTEGEVCIREGKNIVGPTGTLPPLSKILHSTESLLHYTGKVVTNLPTLHNTEKVVTHLPILHNTGKVETNTEKVVTHLHNTEKVVTHLPTEHATEKVVTKHE